MLPCLPYFIARLSFSSCSIFPPSIACFILSHLFTLPPASCDAVTLLLLLWNLGEGSSVDVLVLPCALWGLDQLYIFLLLSCFLGEYVGLIFVVSLPFCCCCWDGIQALCTLNHHFIIEPSPTKSAFFLVQRQSHVSQADLKLTMQLRMMVNL